MQEIIGAMPSRIWRRGILLVLGLVVLLLVVAHFVRYPDVIEVPVELKVNEVVNVKAELNGTLESILIGEGENVNKGDALAVFEGGLDYELLLRLKPFLNEVIRQNTVEELIQLNFPSDLDLSFLPGEASKLKLAMTVLQRKFNERRLDQQIVRLNKEKELIQKLSAATEKQIEKLKVETSLAEKNYRDFKNLFDSGAASGIEVDAAHATLLRLEATLESKKANLIQYELDLSGIDTRVEYLKYETENALWEEYLQVQTSCMALELEVQQWMETHVLFVPIDGKIVFPERLMEGQSVDQGNTLFSIILPGAGQDLAAVGPLSGQGTGKVEPGMTVKLRLQAYPYKEFGELSGKVERIGEVSASGFFEIVISFPNDRKFESMELKPGMQGIARVITEDRSLLERFLEIFRV